MFSKLSLKLKILLGSAMTLVILVVLGWVAHGSNKSLLESGAWVDHTHRVIGKANNILGAAVNMETGMRGYLLAGKEEFLEPYDQGSEHFFDWVKELQKTVDDNPEQVTRLSKIHDKISDWRKDVVEPNIELRRAIGDAKSMNDLALVVAKAEGKTYFDGFRDQMALFIDREASLLKERSQKVGEAEKKRSEAQELISNTTHWVQHTHKVISEAKAIITAAVDMETGARGFFLAGRGEFLEPYNNGGRAFERTIDALMKTVSDNPDQVMLLRETKEIISQWKSKVIEPAISLRRRIQDDFNARETMEDMADLVAKAEGKVYFDKFRS